MPNHTLNHYSEVQATVRSFNAKHANRQGKPHLPTTAPLSAKATDFPPLPATRPHWPIWVPPRCSAAWSPRVSSAPRARLRYHCPNSSRSCLKVQSIDNFVLANDWQITTHYSSRWGSYCPRWSPGAVYCSRPRRLPVSPLELHSPYWRRRWSGGCY